MTTGPGKYDAACTAVRAWTRADAVLVVVVNGSNGNGFAVQAPPEFLHVLPGVLRAVADQIERDAQAAAN